MNESCKRNLIIFSSFYFHHYFSDIYFDKYFPLALNVSAELERRGGEERYSWTEFPWLIQEYLDNTVNCAHRRRTPDEISKMEEVVNIDSFRI